MLRITKTENGLVRGLPGTDARITVFKGIPYAAAPVGEYRWRPPQPAENWEGVRVCAEFAPISMQPAPGANPNDFYSKEWNVDPEIPMGEDSLAVNIWTNAKTGDEKMPVYVWIYGGGLQVGYAHEMEFDGERMASRGVVVVTLGYRLNAFGFLAHPDLTKENPDAPTNFGFLDQQAAIAWVKRNIANFGGDPDNITIGGQSSGGVSVFSQMCHEGNDGLFQRAIIQSSAGGSILPVYPKCRFMPAQPLEKSEALGVRFLEEFLGVKTIEEARKLPAEFIRDKAIESRIFFFHTVDGAFLTKDLHEYLFSGEMRDIPLILGYTGDEYWFEAQGDTVEEIEAWAKGAYGEYADQFIALWKKEGGDDVEKIRRASRVYGNTLSTQFVAEEYKRQGKDIYCFNFDPEMPGDDAGSFHSSDLWFSFETLMKCWRPFDGHHFDLARKMCNYWTNFIKTGDPNGVDHDGTPMVRWEQYSRENPYTILFFDELTYDNAPLSEKDRLLVDVNLKAYKGE